MKKEVILLTVVILFSVGPLALAQDGEISGTYELNYSSRYIWRGFDVYEDNHSAFRPLSLDVDLFGTGLGVKVFWSRATGNGYENTEEMDVTLYYDNGIYEDEVYATNYRLAWGYYGYPDEPRSGSPTGQAADFQEFLVSLAWPQLCPAGVVPSYTIIRMWASEGESALNENGGWLHILGVGYDMTVPELAPELGEQVVHLSADLVYNDGVGASYAPGGNGTVDHDWSHFVFGASTDFDLGNNLAFSPGIYYQASMEDSVNDSDETWVSLSLKYKF
jgi:hypothetical protein